MNPTVNLLVQRKETLLTTLYGYTQKQVLTVFFEDEVEIHIRL